MDPMQDDAELVRLARGGDRRAVETLVDRHYEGVRAEGLRLLRTTERAEDLAQETFLLATLHLGKLREDARFGGWVRTIARNLARTWLRSDQRGARLANRVNLEDIAMDQFPDEAPSVPEQMISRQDVEALMRAISTLPSSDQDIVRRHYLQHESQRQIAEDLGVNHTTVSRRLDAALRRLRGTLEGSSAGSQRAKLLCGAVVAMPAAARMALAQETATEVARLSLPTWLHLPPSLAPILIGGLAMTGIQKSIAVVVAVIILAAGGYGLLHTPSDPPPPTRIVEVTTGRETSLELKPGESVRLTFDTLNYPQNDMAKYVTDYATVDLVAGEAGEVNARLVKRTGETESLSLGSARPAVANIHVWQEMNLLLVSTLAVEKSKDGARVTYFRANRPDLLPAAKGLEARVEKGQISRDQYVREARTLLADNGLLPQNTTARDAIVRLLAE